MDFRSKLESKLDVPLVEGRPTQVISLMHDISKNFDKTVKIYAITDGAVGLFRTEDGQAYEVQVRPAKYSQYSELLGTKSKSK